MKTGKVALLLVILMSLIAGFASADEGYFTADLGYPVIVEKSLEFSKIIKDVEGYIPNGKIIFKANSKQLDKLIEKNIAENITPYTSESNYDLSLSYLEDENIKVEIQLFDSADKNKILEKLNNLGEITHSDEISIVIDVNTNKLSEIANTEGVIYVEKIKDAELVNYQTNAVSGTFNFRDFWKLYGKDQIIAVGDTGIDTGVNDESMHDDFEGRIQNIVNLASTTLNSYYMLCPPVCSSTSADIRGHGTHVSGSALGDGNKSNSNPNLNQFSGSYAGSAPKSKLVVVDIGSDDPSSNAVYPGNIFTHYLPAGYKNNAKIMSGSWVYSTAYYGFASNNLDKYVYQNQDFLVIHSAGNSGPNSVKEPGIAKNAISVGANFNNNINMLASFSSTGPTPDGRIKPDLIAPGVNTISAKSQIPSIQVCNSGGPSVFYSSCTGTSMSTPVTAGLAALAREYFQKVRNVPNPSAALVKAALINGAEDMGQGIPSFNTGWGRANISNSFPEYGVTNPNTNSVVNQVYFLDEQVTFTGSGQEYSFRVYSVANKKIKATLVWSDKESNSLINQTAPKLINDLDLIVKDPAGNIFNGNDFNIPYNDQFDRLNNVEQARIDNTSEGYYNFTVKAFNVPLFLTPSKFAIVVSYVEPVPTITVQNLGNNVFNITLNDPNRPNANYIAALAFNDNNGIPLQDQRVVSLNPDSLFFFSLQAPQVLGLNDATGTLDNNGQKTIQLNVPSFVPSGFAFKIAFVTIGPGSVPYSIRSISHSESITTS